VSDFWGQVKHVTRNQREGIVLDVETILDKRPTTLHERAPLFLGSCEDIAELVLRGDVRQDGSKTYSV